jgi:hypothetical protein
MRTLPFTSPILAARAAVPVEAVPLPFDTPVSGTLPPRTAERCLLAEPQYVVQYPGGATRIKIEIGVASSQIAGNLFVYTRFGQQVAEENGRFIFDFASLGTSPFYFPTTGTHLFQSGTYFIALSNCNPDPVEFTIRATLLMPPDADTAALSPETSFGQIPPAAPGICSLSHTQYRIQVNGGGPCGGVTTLIGAQSDQNISLYARRDQQVAIEDGRVVADLASTTAGRSQFLELVSRGTYYIAIGNCSTATANFVVSSALIIIDPPFPGGVNGCALVREPNGRFVLEVYGTNIQAGAAVTVGGVTPKKVKFLELEAGSTTSYNHIRLVKKFCGGLPGNVVITNPGPCHFPSAAFFCNERCPD